MTIKRCVLSVAVCVILIPTHCFACDPSALKDHVQQLVESDSPFAGTITFDCIDILRDPKNKSLLSKFVKDFVAAAQLSKNITAASTIDQCSAEDLWVACLEANH
jgi:hypothetical protein